MKKRKIPDNEYLELQKQKQRQAVAKNNKQRAWDKYGNSWGKQKEEALVRDNHKCKMCESDENLEVHHIIPYRTSKSHKLKNLVTLCKRCHTYVGNNDFYIIRFPLFMKLIFEFEDANITKTWSCYPVAYHEMLAYQKEMNYNIDILLNNALNRYIPFLYNLGYHVNIHVSDGIGYCGIGVSMKIKKSKREINYQEIYAIMEQVHIYRKKWEDYWIFAYDVYERDGY